MTATAEHKEHITYTFHAFCKVVIRYASITAWRDRSRKNKREISLEYLTEEKFYPLGTTDEYFKAPYEKHPVTICGQTVILTDGILAAALENGHINTDTEDYIKSRLVAALFKFRFDRVNA